MKKFEKFKSANSKADLKSVIGGGAQSSFSGDPGTPTEFTKKTHKGYTSWGQFPIIKDDKFGDWIPDC